jgi:hypothetical protein
MSYLAGRFESAVLTLVGDGPVKQRLADAFGENLDDLEETELPEALRGWFADLRAALHRVPPLCGEPCVLATVRKMSVVEADRHASSIVRIYGALVRDGGDTGVRDATGPEHLAVVSGGGMKLPRFLAEQGS